MPGVEIAMDAVDGRRQSAMEPFPARSFVPASHHHHPTIGRIAPRPKTAPDQQIAVAQPHQRRERARLFVRWRARTIENDPALFDPHQYLRKIQLVARERSCKCEVLIKKTLVREATK